MTDPSTMAREVAEWLGWPLIAAADNGADFITRGDPSVRTHFNTSELSTLHAALVRERELREALEKAVSALDDVASLYKYANDTSPSELRGYASSAKRAGDIARTALAARKEQSK